MDWHADSLALVSEDVLKRITDDVILDLCFEVHRAVKLNIPFMEEPTESVEKYEIDNESISVFGQEYDSGKDTYVKCPHCEVQEVSYSKFAGHLETCIGRGRKSKINTVNNIKNACKVENYESDEHDVLENDNTGDDGEWNSKRKSKKKTKKNTKPKAATKGRNTLKVKGKNGDSISKPSNLPAYFCLNKEQQKILLQTRCGVVLEDSKEICLNLLIQCPLHDDDQRKNIRYSILGRNFQESPDDDHINVEDDPTVLEIWDHRNTNGTSKKKGRKGNSQNRSGKQF